MANCPRCGAVNQEGKAACWKCLAPIPAPPPARPTPPKSPPERDLSAPVRRKFNIPDQTVAFPKRRANSEQSETDAPVEPIELDDAGETEEPPEETAPPPEEPVLPEAEPAPSHEAIIDNEPAPLAHDAAPIERAAEIAPPRHDKPFARADDEEEAPPPRPKSEFSYIAGAVLARKSTTWIFLLVLLTLLLSGIFFLYYHNFLAQPRPITAEQAAQEYLLALRMKQETTRQQLATPDSRGLLLPTWFTISEALIISVAESGENTASAQARISLAPVRSIDLPQALEKAASSDYDVEFTLERGGKYWLVDQRALFRSLRWQLKSQNPGVSFPRWEGVSE